MQDLSELPELDLTDYLGKKLKSMWGIAWGIKIETSIFERV